MEPCIECEDETADRKYACGCTFCVYCLGKRTMNGLFLPLFCPNHFTPEVPLYSGETQHVIDVGEMATPESFGGEPISNKRTADEMLQETQDQLASQGLDSQLVVAMPPPPMSPMSPMINMPPMPPIPDVDVRHNEKWRRMNPDYVDDEVLENFNQTPPEMSEDEVEMPMDVPAMANWWFLDDPPRRHKYARRMPYYKRRYGRRRSYRRRSYGGRSKSFGLGPMVRGLSRALRLFLSRSNKYRYRR